MSSLVSRIAKDSLVTSLASSLVASRLKRGLGGDLCG
jgi:hypothetical protein